MSTAPVLQMVWPAVKRRATVANGFAIEAMAKGVARASAGARRATPEMAFYRKYTEGMMRRYFKMSMEAGRVPSMLGRELFRGRVTSYRVHTFEDNVIFVHDVEACVKLLDAMDQSVLYRVAVQEYTLAEVAVMFAMSERTVARRYREALDELTAVFLERKLLEPMAASGCF